MQFFFMLVHTNVYPMVFIRLPMSTHTNIRLFPKVAQRVLRKDSHIVMCQFYTLSWVHCIHRHHITFTAINGHINIANFTCICTHKEVRIWHRTFVTFCAQRFYVKLKSALLCGFLCHYIDDTTNGTRTVFRRGCPLDHLNVV